MSKLYAFDPAQVEVTVMSQSIVGFSEEKVTVERANPGWELTVGADGDATRVKSNDLSGTITITLQQTSPSNNLLSTLFEIDDSDDTGVVAVTIKDEKGFTYVSAPKAYVEKLPEASFAKTHSDRVWVLRCHELTYFLGGNFEQICRTGFDGGATDAPVQGPSENQGFTDQGYYTANNKYEPAEMPWVKKSTDE